MEVDYSPSLGTVETVPIEDPEPLPNVVWGSESWHGQTPEVRSDSFCAICCYRIDFVGLGADNHT